LHASLYELADESIMLGRDYACVDIVVLNLVRITQREWIQVMFERGKFWALVAPVEIHQIPVSES
jgi:hypothetical protein